MTDWQLAMQRLHAAKREHDHAQEVAGITNRMIARVYGLTEADSVDADGTIRRAAAPKGTPPAAAPAPESTPANWYEPLQRLVFGARVWVYEVDAGDEFHRLRERRTGTVHRLRTADGGAWIKLDERLTGDEAALHPFTDEPRQRWVKTYPDKCEMMAAQMPERDWMESGGGHLAQGMPREPAREDPIAKAQSAVVAELTARLRAQSVPMAADVEALEVEELEP